METQTVETPFGRTLFGTVLAPFWHRFGTVLAPFWHASEQTNRQLLRFKSARFVSVQALSCYRVVQKWLHSAPASTGDDAVWARQVNEHLAFATLYTCRMGSV